MTAPTTLNGGTGVRARLSLNDAQSYLTASARALDGWYARHTGEARSYVTDGHETISLIDELLRELHRVRALLIGEIRHDEDQRAVRVDRLLAECRAARQRRAGDGREPGVPTPGRFGSGGAR